VAFWRFRARVIKLQISLRREAYGELGSRYCFCGRSVERAPPMDARRFWDAKALLGRHARSVARSAPSAATVQSTPTIGWWRAASSANGRSGCGISLPPSWAWVTASARPSAVKHATYPPRSATSGRFGHIRANSHRRPPLGARGQGSAAGNNRGVLLPVPRWRGPAARPSLVGPKPAGARQDRTGGRVGHLAIRGSLLCSGPAR